MAIPDLYQHVYWFHNIYSISTMHCFDTETGRFRFVDAELVNRRVYPKSLEIDFRAIEIRIMENMASEDLDSMPIPLGD